MQVVKRTLDGGRVVYAQVSGERVRWVSDGTAATPALYIDDDVYDLLLDSEDTGIAYVNVS